MLKNENLKRFMAESLNSFIEASISAGKEAWTIFMDEIANQMSSNDSSQSEEEFLKQEVYIDTCSFMHQGAEQFFLGYVPLFEQYGKKFNTLSCCIREIEKHLSSDDYNTRNLAQKAKSNIDKLIKAGLLNVVDYSEDVFADADFAAVFIKKRIQEEILFITQDSDLSIDIYNLNNMRSIKGYDITVRSLDDDGDLILNSKLDEYLNSSDKVTDEEPEAEYDEAFEDDAFDDRNQKYGGATKTKNLINNNREQESQPQHSVWEILGRTYEFTSNPGYNRYVINGYEVDENTAISYLNNALAAGENSVERF